MRGDPREEIVNKVEEVEADVLVIGIRGMGALSRLLVEASVITGMCASIYILFIIVHYSGLNKLTSPNFQTSSSYPKALQVIRPHSKQKVVNQRVGVPRISIKHSRIILIPVPLKLLKMFNIDEITPAAEDAPSPLSSPSSPVPAGPSPLSSPVPAGPSPLSSPVPAAPSIASETYAPTSRRSFDMLGQVDLTVSTPPSSPPRPANQVKRKVISPLADLGRDLKKAFVNLKDNFLDWFAGTLRFSMDADVERIDCVSGVYGMHFLS
jgi:hypothetical protein